MYYFVINKMIVYTHMDLFVSLSAFYLWSAYSGISATVPWFM